MSRARENAQAAYTWRRPADIAKEMDSTPQKVLDLIHAGAFGKGNVTRWGKEYRVKPEALEAYLEREAAKLDAEIASAA